MSVSVDITLRILRPRPLKFLHACRQVFMMGRRKLETDFCGNCLQGFGSLFLEMQKQPNEKSHQHDDSATHHDCELYSFHCYAFLLVEFFVTG